MRRAWGPPGRREKGGGGGRGGRREVEAGGGGGQRDELVVLGDRNCETEVPSRRSGNRIQNCVEQTASDKTADEWKRLDRETEPKSMDRELLFPRHRLRKPLKLSDETAILTYLPIYPTTKLLVKQSNRNFVLFNKNDNLNNLSG